MSFFSSFEADDTWSTRKATRSTLASALSNTGFAFLLPLLREKDTVLICINGPSHLFVAKKDRATENFPRQFASQQQLLAAINGVLAFVGTALTPQHLSATVYFADASLHVVCPSIHDDICLTIEKKDNSAALAEETNAAVQEADAALQEAMEILGQAAPGPKAAGLQEDETNKGH